MKVAKKVYLILFITYFCVCSAVDAETVWIDVRSKLEHKVDHIEGDIRISYSEIVDEMLQLHPNRETEIALYCRSGGRAGKAMKALNAAGYQNVRNVGGIKNARQERNLSTK